MEWFDHIRRWFASGRARPRTVSRLCLVFCLLPAPGLRTVAAPAPSDLYVAQAIVTGTDQRDRPRGLAICLGQVLLNVSGDPNLPAHPGFASLLARAATMVTGLDYADRMGGMHKHDEQGTRDRPFTLTASFDPAKVAAALATLGETPRAGPRPAVFLIVQVRGYAGHFQLDAGPTAGYDMAALMRAAVADAARQYKLQATLPSGAAAPPPGAMLLQGELDWSDAAHGWIATWHAGKTRWREQGVSFDDAFRGAMAGALGMASGYRPPA